MRSFLLAGILLIAKIGSGQVTPNPAIERKSVQNVFINKIEITAEHTLFHMQFYDRSMDADFDRFMEENPEIGRRLRNMGLDREQALRLFRERFQGEQTISFQPTSRVVLPDGKSYKFIRAVNIPVSPDRQKVEPGKKYFFKVYFERIPAGFEKIDLLEADTDTDGTFQYWNFHGIKINNPIDRQPVEESPVEAVVVSDFRVHGRIRNAATGEPVHAKVICFGLKSGVDSLQTSRTGKYEFYVNDPQINFTVSSPGFETMEESVNLQLFLKGEAFEKDIYLDPLQPEEAVEVEGTPVNDSATVFTLDKVYFQLGQAVVLRESYAQLDGLAAYLKQHPSLHIQIEGHTDNQGDAAANQKLSLDRAFNVRQYLIDRGVDGKRIRFKGYGSSRPVSPNDNEENRSKNRRVEYSILNE